MITWTPEAERVIYGYLNEVSSLAAARGEDGEELHASLLEHIRTEVSERGWDLVTEDQARQLVAQLGAPEDVVGAEPAPPPHVQAPPPPPVPPRAQAPVSPPPAAPRTGTRWLSPVGCLIMVIVGLVTVFVIVPVLGILAAILLPAFARARYAAEIAEQRAAVEATLRHVAEIQRTFQAEGHVDRDGDGVGDYGTIEELNARYDPDIEYDHGGYQIGLTVMYGSADSPPDYLCTARPTMEHRYLKRRYWVDATGELQRADDGDNPPSAVQEIGGEPEYVE